MECAKVKGLLSEYIDGVLDTQTKALLEKHLSTCKTCSEELASLKAYALQLRSLKEVKAPEDFLEKVHARIERRFTFEKIVHKLFIPLRIKLPLEALAVTAVAILAMFIYRGMQPITDIAQAPKPITVARRPTEKVEERKPIELALVIRPKAQPEISKFVFKKSDKAAKKESLSIFEEAVQAPPVSLTEVLTKVKELISEFEGKIVDVEYNRQTGQPQYLTAEISPEHYKEFVQKLAQVGSIEGASTEAPSIAMKPVSVKIRFILPQ